MKELLEKLKALFAKKDSAPTDAELETLLDEVAKSGVALKDVEIDQLKAALNLKGKSSNNDSSPNAENEALKNTNLALTQQLTDVKTLLTDMKTDRDAGAAAQKEQLEKDTAKKKEEAIAKALKEGKVTEAKKETAEKLFDKLGPELFDEWVKDAPVHPEFKKPDGDGSGENKPGDDKKTIRGPFDAAPKSMMDAMNKMDD